MTVAMRPRVGSVLEEGRSFDRSVSRKRPRYITPVGTVRRGTMYDRILIPTDGSDVAVAAAETGFAFTRRFDSTLHAVHVLDDGDPDQGDQLVTAVEEAGVDLDIETTTAVLEESPSVHDAIIDYVRDNEIDCIVMGTHGRTGLTRLALGSVAERTIRGAPVPVLTVHDDEVIEQPFEDVLVPTDGSDGARAAADHAVDLATDMGAALHVVHVLDDPFRYQDGSPAVLDALQERGQRAVDEIIDRADAADLRSAKASILRGRPARSIAEYANERDVDVVVMGTHGRTGIDRLLLGSVTEAVVRRAEVPVLCVTAPDVVEEGLVR